VDRKDFGFLLFVKNFSPSSTFTLSNVILFVWLSSLNLFLSTLFVVLLHLLKRTCFDSFLNHFLGSTALDEVRNFLDK